MTPVNLAPLPIDFLYFEDCPSHARALEVLREVIQSEGVKADVQIHQVETEEQAEQLKFPGSPTIRIAGVDIDQNPSLPVGLACRAYRHENGRISPLPPRDKIAHAVRIASGGRPLGTSGGRGS
jgi:hypothetical protein